MRACLPGSRARLLLAYLSLLKKFLKVSAKLLLAHALRPPVITPTSPLFTPLPLPLLLLPAPPPRSFFFGFGFGLGFWGVDPCTLLRASRWGEGWGWGGPLVLFFMGFWWSRAVFGLVWGPGLSASPYGLRIADCSVMSNPEYLYTQSGFDTR